MNPQPRNAGFLALLFVAAGACSSSQTPGPAIGSVEQIANVSSALNLNPTTFTQHNDVDRSGWNVSETVLTQASVASGGFGRQVIRHLPVGSGQIVGEVLYLTSINVANRGTHDLLIATTTRQKIFAYDAQDTRDDSTPPPGPLQWSLDLSTLSDPFTTQPKSSCNQAVCCGGVTQRFNGITSTPTFVSDAGGGGLLYVVEKVTQTPVDCNAVQTQNPTDPLSQASYFRVWAVDVTTGLAAAGPVVVGGPNPVMSPNGVLFQTALQTNRPALLVAPSNTVNGQNNLYVGFGGLPDDATTSVHYHGWVMKFPATLSAAPAGDPATMFTPGANNQQHIFFRDVASNVQHVFFDPNSGRHTEIWGGNAAGTPAAMYTANNNQQHLFYRDLQGDIQHVFFDGGSGNRTTERWAGGGSLNNAPFALGDPSVMFTANNNQQHLFYRDDGSNIEHIFFDPSSGRHAPEIWGGNAAGTPATMYTANNNQQHLFYRDQQGDIQHVFFDPGSNTRTTERWAGGGSQNNAPTSASDPAVMYTANNNQQHLFYRDDNGNIEHIFFDPNSGRHAPEVWGTNAAGTPATLYTPNNNQQHLFFRDIHGNIQHVFFDGNTNTRTTEQYTGPGSKTGGPPTAGIPATMFSPAENNQQHVFYLDVNNNMEHVFFDPPSNFHAEVWAVGTTTAGPSAVYNTTPTSVGFGGGGIWQSGNGLVLGGNGNIYFATGNGDADNATNLGDSVVQLDQNLNLVNFFTPPNSALLLQRDMDLSSAGPIFLQSNIIHGGKEGLFYNLSASNLHTLVDPAFRATYNTDLPCLPRLESDPNFDNYPHIRGSPITDGATNPSLYVWGEKDFARKYPLTVVSSVAHFTNVTQRTGLVTYCDDEGCSINCRSAATDPNPRPNDNFFAADNVTSAVKSSANGRAGGFLTGSGRGAGMGIVWGSVNPVGDAEGNFVAGSLVALNADTMATLWQNTADVYVWAKTVPPTVANGKVFLPALVDSGGPADNKTTTGDSLIYVYGFNAPACAATGSCPNGTPCSNGNQCGSATCNVTCQPPACASTSSRCGSGAPCGANGDCGSEVCGANNRCAPPSCSPNCPNGNVCGNNNECGSKVCGPNAVCLQPPCAVAPSAPPLCNQGAPCGANADCGSRLCNTSTSTCQAPVCAPGCASNAFCNNNGDCASHVCRTSNNTCQ